MLANLNEISQIEKYCDRWLPKRTAAPKEVPQLSLREYVRAAWHVVEPGRVFVPNWHIDYIADYLEATAKGQIQNLIINIPPRCMKSLMVSVFFPTWLWTQKPETRWLTSSYAEELAVRDAVKSRRIIKTKWYQERWGSVFQLSGDQNVKSRYENDKTGYRISLGVQSGGTGEGGDYIIVDDPLSAREAYSDVKRNTANAWWDETMSTRGNDQKTAVRIIVMQRLAEDDLTGHVLEKMQKGGTHYEHLCLPMEYEPHRYESGIGLDDPRKVPGELLWPEHIPVPVVKKFQDDLQDAYPGQMQQRPTAKGGAIYQSEWWGYSESDQRWRNRFDAEDPNILEKVVARFIVFDTALKDDESNDFTAHAVGDLTADYRLLLRWVGQERLQFPQLTRHIQDNATFWQTHHRILRAVVIEDKTSGTSAIQTLRQTAPPDVAALIQPFMPVGSKEFRARQASVWCARDCVLLPLPSAEAPWLFEFSEGPYGIYKFPRAAHDDMVDAFTMLILYCEYLLAAGWQARQTPNAAGAGV
jgi:predicted phage terminase large subunit-like protein